MVTRPITGYKATLKQDSMGLNVGLHTPAGDLTPDNHWPRLYRSAFGYMRTDLIGSNTLASYDPTGQVKRSISKSQEEL